MCVSSGVRVFVTFGLILTLFKFVVFVRKISFSLLSKID